MWRPTKNQLHLPSVFFLGSFVSFGVTAESFWFASLSSKNNNADLRPRTPKEKWSLPRASRSLGSHLNGHVFFFLHPFGLHDWLLWEWSQVDPSLLFGVLVFGVWFSLSFSCLNHLPLKDPLGWWLEVMMANNAKKRKGRGRKKRKKVRWPSGLRRQFQVLFTLWREFESLSHQIFFIYFFFIIILLFYYYYFFYLFIFLFYFLFFIFIF